MPPHLHRAPDLRMQSLPIITRVVAHRLIEALAPPIHILALRIGSIAIDPAPRRPLLAILLRNLQARRPHVHRATSVHLPAKREREGPIRHARTRPISKPLREPDVLWAALETAHLVLEDLDDGRDAAEGEAAVAAPFAVRVPGCADPVKLQPLVDGLARVGAEHAVCLEDQQVLGGLEEVFVDPEVGEEGGDFLLRGGGHVGGDEG
ncbi:hypothetical protein V494_07921 [Pseudogymnoascus sp. VKM F-4513 (FW-928)]|nr:hypothetical protein V494_07921 [Pseudogymnoascus sp. VKM F-4513 (FW-928)]